MWSLLRNISEICAGISRHRVLTEIENRNSKTIVLCQMRKRTKLRSCVRFAAVSAIGNVTFRESIRTSESGTSYLLCSLDSFGVGVWSSSKLCKWIFVMRFYASWFYPEEAVATTSPPGPESSNLCCLIRTWPCVHSREWISKSLPALPPYIQFIANHLRPLLEHLLSDSSLANAQLESIAIFHINSNKPCIESN